MKAAFRATKSSECWDWLLERDMVAIASRAYRRARAECRPPPGQKFVLDSTEWSSPADFVDNLTRLLVLHVNAHAHASDIPGHEYAPAQLSRWYSEVTAMPTPDDALLSKDNSTW